MMATAHYSAPPTGYRRGVGIMLLNRDSAVWVGERIDTPGAWQMPQGGIDAGETPRQAALRELGEEIGTAAVAFLAETEDWLCYDLPEGLAGRVWGGGFRGQTQKWFACRYLGRDADIAIATAHPEFAAWRWVPADTLPGLVVPFKRALYEAVMEEFRDFTRAGA